MDHDQEQEQPLMSADDLLHEDPEKARELLAEHKRDRSQGDIQRPPRVDPRFADQSVAPDQADLPAGGSTGSGMGGGTSQHRKASQHAGD